MITYFDSPSLDIPSPEGSDQKEVYAFFGLCSFYSQVFERGLINLAVILHSKGHTKITGKVFEEAFQKKERFTLGNLITDVKKQIEIDSHLEEELYEVLKSRNYLIHEFFVKHDIDFGSTNGRADMIKELRTMTFHFQKIDKKMEEITHPLWIKIGITKEMVESELENMYAESCELDTIS